MSIIYINPYRFAPAYDPDAQDFINRVIAADVAAGNTSGLEVGVQDAYNAFVVGCKSDGIWNAIKASCILAGARTLSGCLVPLVGAAPANNNFVGADYNRKAGLAGNATNKSIDTNRLVTADPQNSCHVSVYYGDESTGIGIGGFGGSGAGSVVLTRSPLAGRMKNVNYATTSLTSVTAGFCGFSRASSFNFVAFANGVSETVNQTSSAFSGGNLFTHRFGGSGFDIYSLARIAFYSIGESLSLPSLNTRVTTLINAIAAAIP
jgi:hypothetical protein